MSVFTAMLSALLLMTISNAQPTNTKRDCPHHSTQTIGAYQVQSNVWNAHAASSGGQCFSVGGLSNGVLSWTSNWSWNGGTGQVKSYSNAVADIDSQQLSSISSLPSTFSWSYSGDDLVANVAYDMFTSSVAYGRRELEVMVWLASYGDASPISDEYACDGRPMAIASTEIDGISFDLYKGWNGRWTVYSFVAWYQKTSFSGDMMDFFNYLIYNHGYSSSQYLLTAGAGTEAFTGSNAVFTASGYTLVQT